MTHARWLREWKALARGRRTLSQTVLSWLTERAGGGCTVRSGNYGDVREVPRWELPGLKGDGEGIVGKAVTQHLFSEA